MNTQEEIPADEMAVESPAEEAPVRTLAVGRMVNYILPFGPHKGEIRPAIVVAAWSDTSANLLVFLDGTNDMHWGQISSLTPPFHWATSASLEPAEKHLFGSWHWPEMVK